MIYENNKIFAFMDAFPVTKGHALVVPREHHADLLDTPDEVLSEMISKTKKIAPAVVKAVKAEGFVISFNTKKAAGQSVFHTHLHIIPRWENDGLKNWPPMKTPSPEELQKLAEEIKAKL